MSTQFDLVLYGATGFTGRLAAKYIAANHRDLRIAIAGRNRQKLERLRTECGGRLEILIADSSDPASVEAMAEQTRVVLSFAGPFSKFGEPVIAACVKHGRDYLDITGETPFIRDMIDKYQAEALRTGARLIPFSGFDSIPADLSVKLALDAARDEKIELDDLQFHYSIKGGFNGGTLETALHLAEEPGEHNFLDGNILVPDQGWPRAGRLAFKAQYQPYLQRWTTPFLMGPINRAVVRRSAWLRAQRGKMDPAFAYEERFMVGKRFGALQATLGVGVLGSFHALSKKAVGRSLIRKVGPKPGEGPSEKDRREGFFKGQLIGSKAGRARVIVTMKRHGDPGNEVTIALAWGAAQLAVRNDFVLGAKGFLTPTEAFGDKLKPQLEAEGFEFDIDTAIPGPRE